MKKSENKTVVITGATSGMALAKVKLFAEQGAYVFITGRRLDEAGLPTVITENKGFIHDYGMLNPLANILAVKYP
jgi:NADP-dependent 3-hydroxy acid dehydrogenase YdfG